MPKGVKKAALRPSHRPIVDTGSIPTLNLEQAVRTVDHPDEKGQPREYPRLPGRVEFWPNLDCLHSQEVESGLCQSAATVQFVPSQ